MVLDRSPSISVGQMTRQIAVCPEENSNETCAPCKACLQLSHFILDTNLELFQFVSLKYLGTLTLSLLFLLFMGAAGFLG